MSLLCTHITWEWSPLVGGCGGSSSPAGTYVVPGMHFEHCLLSAGRCREPWHFKVKHSSSIISAHSDWCGAGIALCNRDWMTLCPLWIYYTYLDSKGFCNGVDEFGLLAWFVLYNFCFFSLLVSGLYMLYHNCYCIFSRYIPLTNFHLR
jgi:hypothetical protein